MPPKEFDYWCRATVLSIHDGDTMTLNIDRGARLYSVEPIRFYRINAPELFHPGGKEARDYLRNLVPIGSEVRVQTFKNLNDKYGRWLGDLWAPHAETGVLFCLNDHMVQAGHASYKAY